MRIFKSPQTGSIYTIANSGEELFVSYRPLGGGTYRVRVQGNPETLDAVKAHLQRPGVWSDLKDGDHISVVVTEPDLADAVADAVRAIIRAQIDLEMALTA